MKKLIIVISSMSFGGAEIQTLELANGLVCKDYDIDIIVLDHRDGVKNRADHRIRFHFMNKKSYLDWEVISKLKTLIHQQDPHLILSIDMYPAMYLRFALLGIKKRYKVIAVLHSTLPRNAKEQFQRSYLTRLLSYVDKIIFVSKNQQDYWLSHYPLKKIPSVYIHNGISVERFSEFRQSKAQKAKQRKDCGFETGDIILGNCSHFRVEKNHKALIEVTRNLIDKGYPVRLLLIGDGDMIEPMRKQIQDLDLNERVYITGHQEDIRPYLDLIDIFVLPSKAIETLSIAAIESMAMGKALVLSDIGGASEIVEEGVNGYLYPTEQTQLLQTCIEKMIQKKEWTSMGEHSRQRAKQRFHKEKMIREYIFQFERTMRIHSTINYIYRIDDIHAKMDWNTFNQIMQIFRDAQVVPLLGLVPDNQDEFLNYGKENREYYSIIRQMIANGEIEVSQHGYRHLYCSKQHSINQILYGRSANSEFCGLSYEEQLEMIRSGKQILMENGITEPDIWMAPSHTNDHNTLKALKDLGFRYVTDGIGLYPFYRQGLKFIPQQIFHPRKVFPFGVYTICLHLFDLDEEMMQLIREHVNNQNNIISFRDALEIKLKWYYGFGNLLYKSKRVLYFHVVRRYRNLRGKSDPHQNE